MAEMSKAYTPEFMGDPNPREKRLEVKRERQRKSKKNKKCAQINHKRDPSTATGHIPKGSP